MVELFEKSEPCSVVDILRQRAAHAPVAVAYRFLQGRKERAKEISYGELDERAKAIAGWLMSRYETGSPIALIFPPGLEFVAAFYGTLYAGGVAVPLSPPTYKNSIDRLEAVLENANCKVALTTFDQLPRIASAGDQCPVLSRVEFVAVETIGSDSASSWRDPCTDADAVALVQYTSGSTATPKGVCLRGRNLLHNISLMMRVSGLASSDVGVSWLPHYHDMGLIAGILMPAFGGFPVTLLSPRSFLADPSRWLDAISTYGATVSGAPNFAYEECVRRIGNEEIDRVDLSSWRVAYCGAEPVRADTMRRFVSSFARRGFRERSFFPCYGLAEATLMVTGGPAESLPVVRWLSKADLQRGYAIDVSAESPDAAAVLASGSLIPDNKVIIVDPETRCICESRRVGEIWLAGSSVADRYWNSAEATNEAFRAFLADTGAGPFHRTGDLGFVDDGMLFVVGRRKDLIIIRGLNHFPPDIELTVERCHPSVVPGCGAAFSIDVEEEEKLVIAHEIDRHLAATEYESVFASIVASVSSQHGLQVYAIALVKQGAIAKTTSGKVQRQRIKAEFLSGRLPVVSQWQVPRNEGGWSSFAGDDLPEDMSDAREEAKIESALVAELAQLLQIDINQVDPQRSIYDLGVDSLLAAQLQNRIQSKWDIEITLPEIMKSVTIRRLTSLLFFKKMGVSNDDAPGQLAHLVERVEQLSEDEVVRMLRDMKRSGHA